MKKFEIYEDTEYDRYIIFLFENNVLCGMNYHHGVGDLDIDYMKSDSLLFKIYLERSKRRANNEDHIDVARASIQEHLIRMNKHESDEVIGNLVRLNMEVLLERLFASTFVKNTMLDDKTQEILDMHEKATELIFQKIIENKYRYENKCD